MRINPTSEECLVYVVGTTWDEAFRLGAKSKRKVSLYGDQTALIAVHPGLPIRVSSGGAFSLGSGLRRRKLEVSSTIEDELETGAGTLLLRCYGWEFQAAIDDELAGGDEHTKIRGELQQQGREPLPVVGRLQGDRWVINLAN